MPLSRLVAKPIAEGFMQTSTGLKLAWREFRWNTGKTSKMWFVDSENVGEGQIEVREFSPTAKPEHKS